MEVFGYESKRRLQRRGYVEYGRYPVFEKGSSTPFIYKMRKGKR